jgi:hypothetical protein
MSKDTSSKQSLGDIILQKIREKDSTVSTGEHPFFAHHSYPILGSTLVA